MTTGNLLTTRVSVSMTTGRKLNMSNPSSDSSSSGAERSEQVAQRARQLQVVSKALAALESDASRDDRADAFDALRDEFYPIELGTPCGWHNGVLYCYGGCGTRYADSPRDLIVPTPLWNRIAVGPPFDESQTGIEREGRGGVLCPTCIIARLAALPETTVICADIEHPVATQAHLETLSASLQQLQEENRRATDIIETLLIDAPDINDVQWARQQFQSLSRGTDRPE